MIKRTSVVEADGRIEIPAEIREAAGLDTHAVVDFVFTDDGLRLCPRRDTDPDQWWFWTPEWQAGERAADEEYAAGRGEIFYSDEEFLRALHEDTRSDADL